MILCDIDSVRGIYLYIKEKQSDAQPKAVK